MARTIDELARLSGVSRATVSRVINGGSVSDRTRRRVQAVLVETNYRPNLAARSLASGRSGVVAWSCTSTHLIFRDPYFGQLMQGMSGALADVAAGMMLWLGNRSKGGGRLGTILSMGLLDGVIVTAHNSTTARRNGLLGVVTADGARGPTARRTQRELRRHRQRPFRRTPSPPT